MEYLLAQLNDDAIGILSKLADAIPAVVGILVVIWLQHRSEERKIKRNDETRKLQEQVWVDVAKQSNRQAQDSQRLHEKTLDTYKEASESFGRMTTVVMQMDQARQTFERQTFERKTG